MHSLGKNTKLHEMKNEKNYVGFIIHKTWQILKRFSRALICAQTSYFWRVNSRSFCCSSWPCPRKIILLANYSSSTLCKEVSALRRFLAMKKAGNWLRHVNLVGEINHSLSRQNWNCFFPSLPIHSYIKKELYCCYLLKSHLHMIGFLAGCIHVYKWTPFPE